MTQEAPFHTVGRSSEQRGTIVAQARKNTGASSGVQRSTLILRPGTGRAKNRTAATWRPRPLGRRRADGDWSQDANLHPIMRNLPTATWKCLARPYFVPGLRIRRCATSNVAFDFRRGTGQMSSLRTPDVAPQFLPGGENGLSHSLRWPELRRWGRRCSPAHLRAHCKFHDFRSSDLRGGSCRSHRRWRACILHRRADPNPTLPVLA